LRIPVVIKDIENHSILSCENLSKQLRAVDQTLTILSEVNLQIAKGEAVAIVGASGSGKSTLLSLLAGLDVASSGSVTLCGAKLDPLNEDARAAIRAKYVGFVFQSFQLLPTLSALENVMLPLELRGERNAEAPARQMLTELGLGNRLSHYPRQLSGGEQQRVAIARAFVTQPKILFADEPTGNLDSVTGASTIERLFALNAEHGTSLVLVTHDATLAARCHRQVVLVAGRIQSGVPR
jgi:putative ABC transport system ATP-binding protein